MVRLDLVAALLAATTLAGAVAPNPPAIVPGAYIIEYAEDQVRAPGRGPPPLAAC
jgi:hypothetical protein